jgi:tyrosyl-tRNA synthetase
MSGAAVLDDLAARGLLNDSTDREALASRLDAGPVTLYCGFDPSASSLHVGNLFPLLALRRFQIHGHRPIVLAGGATGMIGDPGGKSEERNLLDSEGLAANLAGIVPQLGQFLDFEGPAAARLLDNQTWTNHVSIIDFLRDVGKHVTVNHMVAKESVKNRMASESGISFTEFSYMLLQAHDYLRLAENEDCELQIGGSDQWGNILLGVDLVRRSLGRTGHALTVPLLLRADGSKYGKTAGGETQWLDAERMSPYKFHQSFLAVEDAEVEVLLKALTFVEVKEIADVVAAHADAPEQRTAQRRLADELTTLVHGPEATSAATEAARLLFGEDDAVVGPDAFVLLAAEIPTSDLPRSAVAGGLSPVDLAVGSVAKSKGEARRLVDQGGLYCNGRRLGPDDVVEIDDLRHGRYLLIRKGKRTHHLIRTTA